MPLNVGDGSGGLGALLSPGEDMEPQTPSQKRMEELLRAASALDSLGEFDTADEIEISITRIAQSTI